MLPPANVNWAMDRACSTSGCLGGQGACRGGKGWVAGLGRRGDGNQWLAGNALHCCQG
jgi:hypothetical protein